MRWCADRQFGTGVPAVQESLSGGKLRPIRLKSDGGIRDELGNRALGMSQLLELFISYHGLGLSESRSDADNTATLGEMDWRRGAVLPF